MSTERVSRSKESPLPSLQIQHHIASMRRTGLIVGGVLVVLAVGAFFMPRMTNDLLSPGGATLVGAATALWIGFSANRDARTRMERVKLAFAVHGEATRLLKAHHWAYFAVLVRLLAIAGCGVVVSIWGAGPRMGLPFFILAGILMAMAWPTDHKTRLLIRRAQELRPGND